MGREKKDPEDKLRALSMEIATKSGEILREHLSEAGTEGAWSVKDMASSVCTWLEKTSKLSAKAPEPPKEEKETGPTLEDTRKAVNKAKEEIAIEGRKINPRLQDGR